MKYCKRCVLNDKSPGVIIDQSGLCNVCRQWDKQASILTNYPELQAQFKEKMEQSKGKFSYDVLVGMSGGKDGVYVAYALKKIYGLKVLAITADYGFMPNDFAKENVARIVQALGIDHQYITLPPSLVQKLIGGYLNFPTNISPCHMCTTVLGSALAYKLAVDMKIPKLLTGLDRGQLFAKIHLSHVQQRVQNWLSDFDSSKEKEEATKILNKLHRYFGNLGLSGDEKQLVLPSLLQLQELEQTPELVNYFVFHPYDEEEIKNTIARELGWQRPSNDQRRGHFDCELKTAAACAATQLGLGERLAFELSVDIREGKIERDMALEIIQKGIEENKQIASPYQKVESVLGIPAKKFEQKLKRLSRIAPLYSLITNLLLRIFGQNKWTEKLIFLIRPH